MELISGGYYKASVHRVIQPAEDQRGYTRLGVFYFSLPDNNQSIQTVSGSPLLERLGIKPKFADGEAPTAGAFIKARTSAYIGKTNLKRTEKEGIAVEEDIVSGAVVKHYY
jgi:isopenicillin N synthase-like dioxygenase